jgi:hypothetical protein
MDFNKHLFYRIAISNFSLNYKDFPLKRFNEWLSWIKNKKANTVLIREWNWSLGEKLHALELINQWDLIPILHSPEQENKYGYYHWNSHFTKKKPPFQGIHGVSCHSLEDIRNAEKNNYSYSFLSPIYPTQTHPDTLPLGIEYLQKCIQKCKIPIIALGGIIHESHIQAIQNTGAQGFASILYFALP